MTRPPPRIGAEPTPALAARMSTLPIQRPRPTGAPAWLVTTLLLAVGLATTYVAYWIGYTDALAATAP